MTYTNKIVSNIRPRAALALLALLGICGLSSLQAADATVSYQDARGGSVGVGGGRLQKTPSPTGGDGDGAHNAPNAAPASPERRRVEDIFPAPVALRRQSDSGGIFGGGTPGPAFRKKRRSSDDGEPPYVMADEGVSAADIMAGLPMFLVPAISRAEAFADHPPYDVLYEQVKAREVTGVRPDLWQALREGKILPLVRAGGMLHERVAKAKSLVVSEATRTEGIVELLCAAIELASAARNSALIGMQVSLRDFSLDACCTTHMAYSPEVAIFVERQLVKLLISLEKMVLGALSLDDRARLWLPIKSNGVLDRVEKQLFGSAAASTAFYATITSAPGTFDRESGVWQTANRFYPTEGEDLQRQSYVGLVAYSMHHIRGMLNSGVY